MKKQKSMGNKGFSLVELIIVIAIMAILVGVLAPQLLKYVERSRQAKDTQAVDTVHTAIVTAMLDPMVTDAPATATYNSLADLYSDSTDHDEFVKAVQEISNQSDATKVEGDAFTSKAYQKKNIKITIKDNKVTCEVDVNAGVADAKAIKIE